ncbi:MAG: succinate dehydrogenase assembly factor 4 [Alphaproteobacteria bacterium]
MLHKNPVPKPETAAPAPETPEKLQPAQEYGGQAGPEPTRYGDWENKGRCTDF